MKYFYFGICTLILSGSVQAMEKDGWDFTDSSHLARTPIKLNEEKNHNRRPQSELFNNPSSIPAFMRSKSVANPKQQPRLSYRLSVADTLLPLNNPEEGKRHLLLDCQEKTQECSLDELNDLAANGEVRPDVKVNGYRMEFAQKPKEKKRSSCFGNFLSWSKNRP